MKFFSSDLWVDHYGPYERPRGTDQLDILPNELESVLLTWRYNGKKFMADEMTDTAMNDIGFDTTRLRLLILTMGEAENTCLASRTDYFRRAVIRNGMPAEPITQFHNNFVFAGHAWPEKFDVYHMDFRGGRIAFGPASERISPTFEFITACAKIFGFREPIFDVAIILGGRHDYRWIFDPRNHEIPLPAPEFVPTIRGASAARILGELNPLDIPLMLETRLQSLQTNCRKAGFGLSRRLVVFYLGVGQRSQQGELGPVSATYMDAGSLSQVTADEQELRKILHDAFCHLRHFMLAQESQQNLGAGYSYEKGNILYTTVSSGYFPTVTQDGVPALHTTEPFVFEVLFPILRGLAYLYLGEEYLLSVTFPACAGQFQVGLRQEAQGHRDASFQMAVSPLLPHTHYGHKCQGKPYTINPFAADEYPEGAPAFRRRAYVMDPIRDRDIPFRPHVSCLPTNFSKEVNKYHSLVLAPDLRDIPQLVHTSEAGVSQVGAENGCSGECISNRF